MPFAHIVLLGLFLPLSAVYSAQTRWCAKSLADAVLYDFSNPALSGPPARKDLRFVRMEGLERGLVAEGMNANAAELLAQSLRVVLKHPPKTSVLSQISVDPNLEFCLISASRYKCTTQDGGNVRGSAMHLKPPSYKLINFRTNLPSTWHREPLAVDGKIPSGVVFLSVRDVPFGPTVMGSLLVEVKIAIHELIHVSDHVLLDEWAVSQAEKSRSGKPVGELFTKFGRVSDNGIEIDAHFLQTFLESRAYAGSWDALAQVAPDYLQILSRYQKSLMGNILVYDNTAEEFLTENSLTAENLMAKGFLWGQMMKADLEAP